MSDTERIKAEIDIIYSHIIGNMNRICVTNDRKEISTVTYYIFRELNSLIDFNFERLKNDNRLNSTADK